jgi:hypothetical protein
MQDFNVKIQDLTGWRAIERTPMPRPTQQLGLTVGCEQPIRLSACGADTGLALV